VFTKRFNASLMWTNLLLQCRYS